MRIGSICTNLALEVSRRAITLRPLQRGYEMTQTSKNTSKPWLDQDGNILSDKELREISKNWSTDTWEQFLLETVECQASDYREDLIHPRNYDRRLEEMTESVWQCSTDRSETIGELVRRLCRDHLSPKQQYIVRMIFWDGFTERKIADVMNISRSTVVVQKRRALSKIKDLIESRYATSTMYEGINLKTSFRKDFDCDDIHEVYLQETSGNQFGKF